MYQGWPYQVPLLPDHHKNLCAIIRDRKSYYRMRTVGRPLPASRILLPLGVSVLQRPENRRTEFLRRVLQRAEKRHEIPIGYVHVGYVIIARSLPATANVNSRRVNAATQRNGETARIGLH
jgi:hypothetical protein